MTLSPSAPSRAHFPEISEQYLKQLGRVAVAASRLDAAASKVVAGMKVDRAVHTELGDALRAAEGEAQLGMPPWSGVSQEELLRWVGVARHLLDERSRLFAALSTHHFSGSDGDAVRMPTADGTIVPADEKFIDRMLLRFHRHDTIGNDLAFRLEHLDQKGTSWPLAVWAVDFAKPDRADAMEWFPGTVAQLPREWRDWLDRAPAS